MYGQRHDVWNSLAPSSDSVPAPSIAPQLQVGNINKCKASNFAHKRKPGASFSASFEALAEGHLN